MTPGELVKAVAIALGTGETTVNLYYRSLRRERLVTFSGRGRSAPISTTLDASRLIIAMLSTDSPTRGAEAVAKIGRLLPSHSIEGGEAYPGLDTEAFSKLSFEDALAYLIDLLPGEGDKLVTDEMFPLLVSVDSRACAEIHFPPFVVFYDPEADDRINSETGAVVSPNRIATSEKMPKGLVVKRSLGGRAIVEIGARIAR